MTMTHAEAHKALMIHLVAFINVDITEALSRSWWIHFADCSIDEFNAALHVAVDQASRGFPPTPGEVRAVLKRLRADASDLEMPEEAWLAVYDRRGTPSPRAIEAAHMIHDWLHRQAWTIDQVEWKRKEFIRIYLELRDRAEVRRVQRMAVDRLGARSLPSAARALLEGSK